MFKLLFNNFKKMQWLFFSICVLLIVGQVALDLKMPDYMSEITKLVQTPNSQIGDIIINGLYMLACALGSAVMSFVAGFFAAKMAAKVSQRIRSKVFNSVLDFSTNDIKTFSTASLITRTTNDVTQIQRFVAMGLQVIVKAPIMAIWAVFKIANKSWQWSLATAISVVLLLLVVVSLIIFVLPKFKIIQNLTDNLNKVTQENLTGVRVVRAFNAEKYEEEKFAKANDKLTKTNLFTNRAFCVLDPVMSLVLSSLMLSIYWIGAYLINASAGLNKLIVFSDMIVFSSYAMQVVMAFIMLTMFFIMFPRASISAKRINEVLNCKPDITRENGVKKSLLKGEIVFDNVSFKYPDAEEYVLENINLSIKKGETIAFIGSTGSGKSTLINLVPRFYDVTDGTIYVDGIDVKDYDLTSLYNKFGYISQKPVLFAGSVKENVTFGKVNNSKVEEKDYQASLSVAEAKRFVDNMEEKDNSIITQSGTNVSGGQKQRIAIARALARKPEILIFDDSFSALDYKTDKKLRSSLVKHFKDTTCLIVAQRIGTIKNADKIIVLENGKIVGEGKHEELLNTCKVYKEIALSQLSKEEL